MIIHLRTFVQQHLPITQWLPKYSAKDAVSDIIGGFTVGIVLVPQSIAFADLAGLGPQYGLYSAWVNGLIYTVFGATKEMSIGPTAVHALLTFTYTHHLNADMAVFFCFASGCVELLVGIFQLSFLVEFVSIPVISAFTSVSAVLLIASQLKNLFGLNYTSDTFVDTLLAFGSHISETRLWDLVLGLTSIVVLLALERLKYVEVRNDSEINTFKNRFINGTIWIIMIGRSGMVMFVAFIMAIIFYQNGQTPFLFMDRIESGLPILSWPPLSTVVGGRHLDCLEMIRELGSGIFVMTVISIVTNVAVAKTFCKGTRVDINQETMILGLCNLVGSFARSMPVACSVSRAGVAKTSGIRTPLAGFHTSLMVILAISFLASYFFYIPRSSIAAVLIVASFSMIDIQIIRKMWLLNKKDLVPFSAAFIVGLAFGIEKGLILGLLLDNLILLYFTARPHISIDAAGNGPVHWMVQPRGSLVYAAVNHVQDIVTRLSAVDQQRSIVLDCDHFWYSDYTAALAVKNIMEGAKAQGVQVILVNANDKVIKSLGGAGQHLTVATSHQHLSQILAAPPT